MVFWGGLLSGRSVGVVVSQQKCVGLDLVLCRSEAGCKHVRPRRRVGAGICKMVKRPWQRLEGGTFL